MRAAAALALLAVLLLAPLLFTGRTAFWGDLTYLHLAWKGATAHRLQQGFLPLWNPFVYMGSPWHANFQTGLFYPGSLPFDLFGFVTALRIHWVLSYFASGWFGWLWLRRLGASRWAALGGAALFMCGGYMISRVPYVNHAGCLMMMPGLLLTAGSPWLFALASTLGFLSGYPTIWAGTVLLALTAESATFGPRGVWRSALAGLAAPWTLGAALAFPAAELLAHTHRTGGLEVAVTTLYSLTPRDLLGWVSPWFLDGYRHSGVDWWRTVHLGFFGAAAACAGFVALPPRLRRAGAAAVVVVSLLTLGRNNALALWAWGNLPGLAQIRYPGNLAYLLVPVFTLAAAAGLQRRAWAPAAALLIALELLVYAWRDVRPVPDEHFTVKGPIIASFERTLEGHRYFLSPRAIDLSRGFGSDRASAGRDLRDRLYGLGNAVYRVDAVNNFGEPLVPDASYRFMDFLFTRPGIDAAAPWLPFVDARFLMTNDPFPAPPGLEYQGENLWHVYRWTGRHARAYWYPESDATRFAGDPPQEAPPLGLPLEYTARGWSGFAVGGVAPARGRVYVSAPVYPGWEVWSGGRRRAYGAAWGSFFLVPVDPGAFDLRFVYRPGAFILGAWLNLLFLIGAAAFWYNRLSSRPWRRTS